MATLNRPNQYVLSVFVFWLTENTHMFGDINDCLRLGIERGYTRFIKFNLIDWLRPKKVGKCLNERARSAWSLD